MFRLAHNESIDLGYSTFILINKKLLDTKTRKELIPESDYIAQAVNELEDQISVSKYKELKVLINKYTLHGYLIRLSCDHPEWKEIELVDYIRGISDQEFFKEYCDYVIGCEQDYSDENIKERIEICTANNSQKEAPTFTTFKYIRSHIGVVKEELIEFLDYYIPLYLSVKDKAMVIAAESLAIYQSAFPDLDAFVDGFNFIKKEIFTDDINLCGYVTAFMGEGVYIFSVSGDSYFVLGSSLTYLLTKEYAMEKETALFKCLAEPTKRQILDLLKKQELCAGDIVTELGLSKSTVSHHMNQLLSANCIYLSLKEGKKMYYLVNSKFIEETLNNVINNYSHD